MQYTLLAKPLFWIMSGQTSPSRKCGTHKRKNCSIHIAHKYHDLDMGAMNPWVLLVDAKKFLDLDQ